MNYPFVIEGRRLECLIRNAHRLLRHRSQFRYSPLWSLVSEITGHGSTVSIEICKSVNLDPDQIMGRFKVLRELKLPVANG
jgi:hypothetical protein